MHTGHTELDTLSRPTVEAQREVRTQTIGVNFDDRNIRLRGSPERHEAALHPGYQRLHRRIIQAQDRRAVKGHLVHERKKRFLDLGQILVMVEMIGFDVGDNGDRGREQQK